jgi:hypothetical protein
MDQKIKVIVSVLITFAMIFGGLMTLMQSPEDQNHSIWKEREKSVGNQMVMSYVESVKDNNLSDKMSFGFYQWLNKRGLTIKRVLDCPSNILLKDFLTFIGESPYYKSLFKKITLKEERAFQKENQREMKIFLSRLENNTLGKFKLQRTMTIGRMNSVKVYNLRASNETAYAFKISSDALPKAICTDYGEWLMVSVNYFKYSLIFTTITYGEHDTSNVVYLGKSAQNYFNDVTSDTSNYGLLSTVILGVLGVGMGAALATVGVSILVSAIVASVILAVGVAEYIESAHVSSKLLELYESTYANENTGKKYIWLYDSINYYYPLQSFGVGSLDSSIGEYGYLSNGNTVTIFPNVPMIADGGVEGIVYISDISGAIHSIANTVGWNNWAYQGCYKN